MNAIASPLFLRRVLWADALSCIACGLLQVCFGEALTPMLGLPGALLAQSGVFLLAYAASVAYIAAKLSMPHPIVWVLVVGNFAWAAACVLLLMSGAVTPTLLGKAYIIMQALTVTVLSELQWMGLRRTANDLSTA